MVQCPVSAIMEKRERGKAESEASSQSADQQGLFTPEPGNGDAQPTSVEIKEQTPSTTTLEGPSPEPPAECGPPPGPAFQKEALENYKPKTLKFWLVIMSSFLSMFLVALDRTIISTAIPRITDDFDSLGDIGFYGSAYMMTTAAFQLVFGRIYKFSDLKWTFLACVLVFEVGSIICAAAPSSPVFILGRAIAGVGSAGITTGCMMMIIPMVPLQKRPMFQSFFGIVFGVASITGPLLGGAFAGRVSWRWCFWINLPVGGVTSFCLYMFLPAVKVPKKPAPVKEQVMRLDPLGTLFFIPSVTSLVLALQWGGSRYTWSNWRIILLFVVFGLTAIAFAIVQVKLPKSASLPVRVISQRSILAGTLFITFLAGGMMLCVYYVPLWFQTTHGVDPVESGIYTLPLVVSLVISSIMSAAITQRIGYYVPSMLASASIMAVGSGLLTTFTTTTGSEHWIPYQFLVGLGVGFGMQTVQLAVQTILPREDIPIGIALTFFAQQLGGAVFVSVGQTILNALLIGRLSGIPQLDADDIIDSGATSLHELVPEQFSETINGAYNFACTRIFLAAMSLALAQLVCAGAMQWKSIKKQR